MEYMLWYTLMFRIVETIRTVTLEIYTYFLNNETRLNESVSGSNVWLVIIFSTGVKLIIQMGFFYLILSWMVVWIYIRRICVV